jgi:hypothetical protein
VFFRVAAARSRDKSTRDMMVAGAVVVIAGLACVGTSHPDVGAVVLLFGWAALGASVHRFGRAAPPV